MAWQWDWMSPATLIDMQRKAAFGHMGEKVRILQREDYSVEADRLLDEMCKLRRIWMEEHRVRNEAL